MAAFVPFDCLALNLGQKIHNFGTDVLKVYLTNTAPVSTNTVYNTPADLPTAGGYTAGGLTTGSNTWTQTGGVAQLAPGGNVSFVATTGFGPFRYAVVYNFTAAAKNLIGYYDNGVAVTLGAGGTFDVDFSSLILSNHF